MYIISCYLPELEMDFPRRLNVLKIRHFDIQEKLPCFSQLLTEKMSLDIDQQEIETEKLKLDALVEQEMKS